MCLHNGKQQRNSTRSENSFGDTFFCNNKNKCPQFARIKYKKNSTAAEKEKEKEKKKAIKRGKEGRRRRRRRRRILVLPENLYSEAHLKHLFIKLHIFRRLHQSIQLSLIQWHYKSCPPPCELTAVSLSSLLFSSLLFASPVPTPPFQQTSSLSSKTLHTKYTTTLSLFPSLSLSRFSEAAMTWLPVQKAIVAHQF
jgi:hypothetical protein